MLEKYFKYEKNYFNLHSYIYIYYFKIFNKFPVIVFYIIFPEGFK